MLRAVYLLIYNSPLFPAHWALFIPESTESESRGMLLEANGSASSGFVVNIDHNYEIENSRTHQLFRLSRAGNLDIDMIEKAARSIPGPEKSLRAVVGEGKVLGRVKMKNCQTWVKSLVDSLVEEYGLLEGRAKEVVAAAPKN